MNVLHFLRHWPTRNGGDLVRSHTETIGRKDVAQILAGGNAEFAFGKFAIQPCLAEATEHLPDVSSMLGRIVGVDQYVV